MTGDQLGSSPTNLIFKVQTLWFNDLQRSKVKYCLTHYLQSSSVWSEISRKPEHSRSDWNEPRLSCDWALSKPGLSPDWVETESEHRWILWTFSVRTGSRENIEQREQRCWYAADVNRNGKKLQTHTHTMCYRCLRCVQVFAVCWETPMRFFKPRGLRTENHNNRLLSPLTLYNKSKLFHHHSFINYIYTKQLQLKFICRFHSLIHCSSACGGIKPATFMSQDNLLL